MPEYENYTDLMLINETRAHENKIEASRDEIEKIIEEQNLRLKQQ